MRSILDKRPSVASVLSIVALFAALGGTSYAATKITGKQVQNGTLTGADVKNRSLSGADQKRNTLGGAQINESKLGQVPSAARAAQAAKATDADKAARADAATKADSADQATKAASADAVGPDGVDSAAIKAGAVTAQDLGTTTTRVTQVTVPSGESRSAAIPCQAGERVLSGGSYWTDVPLNNTTAAELHEVYSRPSGPGWQARGYNNTGDNDAKLLVYAMCLN